jgi:hypothetical protein
MRLLNTNLRLAPLLFIGLFISTCTPDGGADGSKRGSQNPSKTPTSEADGQCIPNAGNNECKPAGTGIEKCWNKLLDTQAAKSCAASGKLYNRIKKVCVEGGIKLKSSCTLPQNDMKASIDQLITELGPDVTPRVDQCGTYSAGGRDYQVAYIIAQKYTGGPEGFGSYVYRMRLLCYAPSSSPNQTCSTPELLVSGTSNDQPQSLGCD